MFYIVTLLFSAGIKWGALKDNMDKYCSLQQTFALWWRLFGLKTFFKAGSWTSTSENYWYSTRDQTSGSVAATLKSVSLFTPADRMRRWVCKENDGLKLQSVSGQLLSVNLAACRHLRVGPASRPFKTQSWTFSIQNVFFCRLSNNKCT